MRKMYLTAFVYLLISIGSVQLAMGQSMTPGFILSEAGDPGNPALDAVAPDVIYNATNEEYFVVWEADTLDDRRDIFGQRVNASNGARIGTVIKISRQASPNNIEFNAFDPKVEWNRLSNEYLVVWRGDDSTLTLIDNENEIFGQRLDANGNLLGPMIRVSFMGTDGDGDTDAFNPEIAFNYRDNTYLVAWEADEVSESEHEIYAQLLDSDGSLLGARQRLSFHGQDGDASFDADDVDIAFNATENEFMLVWEGEEDAGQFIEGEREIYAIRLDHSGIPLAPAFRISDIGSDGDEMSDALSPEIAWNSDRNEYLVVFGGDSIPEKDEIHGQRLSAAGLEIGPNDFRISTIAAGFDSTISGGEPSLIYNERCRQYLVAFTSESPAPQAEDGEFEIFSRRLTVDGRPIGGDSLLSLAGSGLGDKEFDAEASAVAFNPVSGQYLVVYESEDTINGLVEGKNVIFGQLKGCCFGPRFDSCPSDTVVTPATFSCTVPVSWLEPSVEDGCLGTIGSQTAIPGDQFSSGVNPVTYAVRDSLGNNDTCRFHVEIATPLITNGIVQLGDSLCTTIAADSYQWFFNTAPIAGATKACYVPTQSGDYRVEFFDSGCLGAAEFANLVVGVSAAPGGAMSFGVTVFPVSARDTVRVRFEHIPRGTVQLEVLDLNGKSVLEMNAKGRQEYQLDLSKVDNGTYMLRARTAENIFVQRIQVRH